MIRQTPPYSHYQPQTLQGPRFGWTRKNPPQNYNIRLSRADFSDFKRLQPSPAFVKNIAERLVGESDEDHRFALITNTLAVLQTPERVAKFEKNLFKAVIDCVRENHADEIAPFDWTALNRDMDDPFPEISGDIVDAVHDNNDDLRGALEGYGSVPARDYRTGEIKIDEKTGKPLMVSSYKELHTDGQSSRIFNLRYGPTINVKGGVPRVADARQYRRDRDLEIPDISGPNGVGIYKQHVRKLREKYTIELEGYDAQHDMPILFLNNTLEGGVLHGATRATRIDQSKPATRPINGWGWYLYSRGSLS